MRFFLLLQFLLLGAPLHAQIVNEGRIKYYPFSGNANDTDGTLHGIIYGATPTYDRFGNANSAYYYDGINDYIEIPHSDELNFSSTQDFAISLWVNIAANQQDMRGPVNDILGKWDDGAVGYPYAIRYRNENNSQDMAGRINTIRFNSNSCLQIPVIAGECAIGVDEWHHIVFQKQGETLFYYQDGLLFGTEIDNTPAGCTTKNNLPIQLGKRSGGKIVRLFTGSIDDLSFYNRPLSQSEINMILFYNNWHPIGTDGTETDFLSYTLTQEIHPSIINSTDHTINAKVFCDTDLSQLTPSFTMHTDANAEVNGQKQVSGVSSNNFTNPLIYKITNSTFCAQQDWVVTISREEFSEQEIMDATGILDFEFQGIDGTTQIDPAQNRITVDVPCTTNVGSLIPVFTHPVDAEVTHDGKSVSSGIDHFDFTKPVIFTVTNELLCASRAWEIVASYTDEDIDEIDITNEEYMIPNVFTPNGDEFNQTWALGTYFTGSKVTILNRFGKTVFKSDYYKDDFDGDKLSSGVYFYLIETGCVSEPIKGPLSILY